MESIFNFILFVMAIVGAVLLANFLVQRHMAWYWKALVLVIAVMAIGGFYSEMRGGPKTDLRIFTELLATGGVIFSLEYGFRHIRTGMGRAWLVLPAGIFLFLMWQDTVDRLLGTVASASTYVPAPAPTPTPAPAPVSTSGGLEIDMKGLCSDPSTHTWVKKQHCSP